MFGTADFQPDVSKPETGVIRVSAETTMPNVFMQMFGYQRIPIEVTCDASLNFVNTDVVLVLDVTGSMADPIDGEAKIDSLKAAVMALYDELAPVQQQLGDLLDEGLVSMDKPDVFLKALECYGDSTLDFVDTLLWAYQLLEGQEVFTFDSKLLKHIQRAA